jgi:hypothetical protein
LFVVNKSSRLFDSRVQPVTLNPKNMSGYRCHKSRKWVVDGITEYYLKRATVSSSAAEPAMAPGVPKMQRPVRRFSTRTFHSKSTYIPTAGWSILFRLPSVSRKETYCPIPGISMGSPSTSPPALVTLVIDSRISLTPITTDGYCAGQSGFLGNKPPLIAPAGAPGFTSLSAVVTSI